MEKLESFNDKLFENFKENEISQLHKIMGGIKSNTWTNEGTDYVGGSSGGTTNDWYNTSFEPFTLNRAILEGYVKPEYMQ